MRKGDPFRPGRFFFGWSTVQWSESRARPHGGHWPESSEASSEVWTHALHGIGKICRPNVAKSGQNDFRQNGVEQQHSGLRHAQPRPVPLQQSKHDQARDSLFVYQVCGW